MHARLDVRTIPMERVHPNPWNPNKMSKRMKTVLRTNLENLGYSDPMTVRTCPMHTDQECWEIVDGEHRYHELKAGGVKEADFVVVVRTDAEAKLSTLAMNNVRGKADPVALANLIVDMTRNENLSVEEIASLTGYTEDEIAKLADDTKHLEGDGEDGGGDAPPPLKTITITLTDAAAEEDWHAAMSRAENLMTDPEGVALVGDQVPTWESAIKRAQKLTGTKLKSKALEFILRTFLATNEIAVMPNIPDIPDELPPSKSDAWSGLPSEDLMAEDSSDFSLGDSRLNDIFG